MTATSGKFSAEGVFNGFTYALDKVRVDGYDNWTALGGNRKGGSVTESGKGLAQAVNIFWNSNSAELEYDWDGTFSSFNATLKIDIDAGEAGIISWTDLDDDRVNGFFGPNERAVYKFFDAGIDGYDPETSNSYELDYDNKIVRMYNGPDDDESNFVGYGLGRRMAQADIEGVGSTFGGFIVHSWSNNPDPGDYLGDKSEYITVSEAHVIGSYYEYVGGGPIPGIAITGIGNVAKCVVPMHHGTETFTLTMGYYGY